MSLKKIKEFSRSYIFLSFLYVAIGVVLLIWPTLSIQMIGRGLGVIMLVVGATYGVIYFTSNKRQEGYLQVELVIGIVCVAFGIFVLLTPDFMRMVLPFAMATVLLVGAIVKIQSAVSMKRLFVRRWYVALIAALIIIALGVFLLVYPFAEDYQMLIYIGICLIADGVTNLLGLLCIRLRTGKLEKIQKNNPGVNVQALIEDEWAKADAAKAEKKARKQEKKEQKRQKEQEIVVESEEISENPASEEGADASGAENASGNSVVPANIKRNVYSADEKEESGDAVTLSSNDEDGDAMTLPAKNPEEFGGKQTKAESRIIAEGNGTDDTADAKKENGNPLMKRARLAIAAKKHGAENDRADDPNPSPNPSDSRDFDCGCTDADAGGEEQS
ncbi:MAG: DUF308 domain-containing protein [Lachnospiraceae bacterium]|nr:DUF308 domain-containing protein [Lachnospiraceae bacterium]